MKIALKPLKLNLFIKSCEGAKWYFGPPFCHLGGALPPPRIYATGIALGYIRNTELIELFVMS